MEYIRSRNATYDRFVLDRNSVVDIPVHFDIGPSDIRVYSRLFIKGKVRVYVVLFFLIIFARDCLHIAAVEAGP